MGNSQQDVNKDIELEFYEYLADLLVARSLTATDLARAIPCDPSLIQQWLRGNRVPSLDNPNVQRIPLVLELSELERSAFEASLHASFFADLTRRRLPWLPPEKLREIMATVRRVGPALPLMEYFRRRLRQPSRNQQPHRPDAMTEVPQQSDRIEHGRFLEEIERSWRQSLDSGLVIERGPVNENRPAPISGPPGEPFTHWIAYHEIIDLRRGIEGTVDHPGLWGYREHQPKVFEKLRPESEIELWSGYDRPLTGKLIFRSMGERRADKAWSQSFELEPLGNKTFTVQRPGPEIIECCGLIFIDPVRGDIARGMDDALCFEPAWHPYFRGLPPMVRDITDSIRLASLLDPFPAAAIIRSSIVAPPFPWLPSAWELDHYGQPGERRVVLETLVNIPVLYLPNHEQMAEQASFSDLRLVGGEHEPFVLYPSS